MKNFIILSLLALTNFLYAQLSAPNVEDVYGGRINAITGIETSPQVTRIFIATESANSAFYMDVSSYDSVPTFSTFRVVPALSAAAGHGSGIRTIAAHSNSGYFYFAYNNQIKFTKPEITTVTDAYTASGMIETILILDDYLFFTETNKLHFGLLDLSGNFTENFDSPLTFTDTPGLKTLFKNPSNNRLYLFIGGTSPTIFKFNSTYDSLSSTTTITTIMPSTLSSINWKNFGIGPDGRLFIAGVGSNKLIAYSIDEVNWTELSISPGNESGYNFDFSGDSSSYYVYLGSMYSTYKGESGTWFSFGQIGGMETHPNDGSVFVDPVNSNLIYMTTDQGIGASHDRGVSIFEIDDGVEAVQVKDFSMTVDKNSAWLASKSGIRKVVNYLTFPEWTNAIFPWFDGSPYYSIEMSKEDTNRVFAGNVRIYRTTDNGNNWNRVFTPENPPYNFPSVGTSANAIEECSFSPNIVMAGFEIQGSDKGGLFVSEDYGNSWTQILLEASSIGNDVDVSDIIFVNEGGDTVSYVGVIYDLSSPQGRSVYRIIKNGSTWIASQDMNASGTSTGSLIVATIRDLTATSTTDTIFATGTDAGINHPVTYYKILSGTKLWTPMTTTGYPFVSGKQGKAVTVGIDTVYVAVDNEIYFYPLTGGTAWDTGYVYPVGTEINFLYYDDLLVGTGYGLYKHYGIRTTNVETDRINENLKFYLEQNYPNPFNPVTIIKYSISKKDLITLKIYDVLGKEIATLVNQILDKGNYEFKFDANRFGLSSGVYFYVLKSGSNYIVKKFVFMK